MNEESDPLKGFHMGELLALRAVVLALIATHPEKEKLRGAMRETAIGLSSTAMQGNQPAGSQDRFDRSMTHFFRMTEMNFENG